MAQGCRLSPTFGVNKISEIILFSFFFLIFLLFFVTRFTSSPRIADIHSHLALCKH